MAVDQLRKNVRYKPRETLNPTIYSLASDLFICSNTHEHELPARHVTVHTIAGVMKPTRYI